jgi:hypothetical protein
MGTSKVQALPPRLQAAQRRFQHWRRTRKVGSRIPRPLWATAVKLAEAYGVHPTAEALGLDYNSMKTRVESASQSAVAASAKAATFLELSTPVALGMSECILELEDVEGAKMRIHFKGIEAPDLAALSRSLWGIE